MKIGYVIVSDIEAQQKVSDSNERNEARKQLREYLQQQGKSGEELETLMEYYESVLDSTAD